MKLHRAIIQNFRSIADATIHFAPPCRILVGLNESGKSNILDALALLDGRKPDAADKREPLPNEDAIKDENSYVRFVFRLESEECAELQKRVASSILAKASNPNIVSVNGKKKTVEELCAIYTEGVYHVNIPQRKSALLCLEHSHPPELLPGWKAVAKNCPRGASVEVGEQQEHLAGYRFVYAEDFSVIPKGALRDANANNITSLIGLEIKAIMEEKLPNVLIWRYAKDKILPTSVQVARFAAKPGDYAPLQNMFTLAGYEDIRQDIEQHKAGSSNKFQNFLSRIAQKTTTHFHHAWNDYKSVKFTLESRGELIVPGVRDMDPNDDANTYDFADRSEGFKRFVSFLLMVSANVEIGSIHNTLLLIDEPEAGLHPSGARALRDLLIRISEKNIVVYSTHSIFMIDPNNIGRHCIVEKSKEQTSVKKAQGGEIVDEEVLYNALGASMFQILKPKNLIFEGWRDKCLFRVALKKAEAGIREIYDHIGRCHARGVNGVSAITPLIELAGREYIVISDSDDPAIKSQTDYKEQRGDGQWFTYQDIVPDIEAITGEDFIFNDYIVKKANGTLVGTIVPAMEAPCSLGEVGKIETIRKWLVSNRMPKAEAKTKINEIKDAIFEGLKPSHVDMDKYGKLLRGIAEKLKLLDGKK